MAAVIIPARQTASESRGRSLGIHLGSKHFDAQERVSVGPRAHLRLIEGGRAPVSHPNVGAVFLRRRIAACVIVAVVCGFVWMAGVSAFGALVGSNVESNGSSMSGNSTSGQKVDLATGGSSGGNRVHVVQQETPASAEYHVVKAGDTLWGIARQIHPDGDIRPVVDELAERAGGADITIGQRLRIDGIGR